MCQAQRHRQADGGRAGRQSTWTLRGRIRRATDKVTPGKGAERDRVTQGQNSRPTKAALPGCVQTVGHEAEATEKTAKPPTERKEAESR